MKYTSALLAFLLTSYSVLLSAQTFDNIPITSGLGGTFGRLVVADIDNDGDPDGIASLNGTLSILKNNGGTFTRVENTNLAFGQNVYSIDAGDINRDGFIDIIHAGRTADGNTEPMRVLLLNNGTQLVPAGNQILGSVANAGALYLGDFEGDGDLDLLSVNGVFLNRNNTISEYGVSF